MRRWLVLRSTVLLGLALLPSSVSAHGEYDRSEPAKNAVVATAPSRVDVWFKQEVFRQAGSNYVRVFNEQDAQVSDGDGAVDDDDRTHISATVQPSLPPGRYVVEWATLSDEDGDTDDGSFCFYVAVQPTAEQEAECATFEDETPGPTEAATATTPAIESATPGAVASPTATEATGGDGGSDDDGAPVGLIVGGIIGGAVAVAVVGGAGFLWLRRTLA